MYRLTLEGWLDIGNVLRLAEPVPHHAATVLNIALVARFALQPPPPFPDAGRRQVRVRAEWIEAVVGAGEQGGGKGRWGGDAGKLGYARTRWKTTAKSMLKTKSMKNGITSLRALRWSVSFKMVTLG